MESDAALVLRVHTISGIYLDDLFGPWAESMSQLVQPYSRPLRLLYHLICLLQ